jgi:hypothetical protein
VLAASFSGAWWLSTRHQCAGALEASRAWWRDAFPPLANPVRLPGWLLEIHAGDLLGHPVGGGHFGSTLTLLAVLAGIAMLVRRRQRILLALSLAPFGLNLAAAALERYPYGGHVRVAMFLTPCVCLLAALGVGWGLDALAARHNGSRVFLSSAVVALAALACGFSARDLCHPYRSESDRRLRDLCRWLWSGQSLDGPVLCVRTDLGETFTPQRPEGDDSALYLCNQRICRATGCGQHASGSNSRAGITRHFLGQQRPSTVSDARPASLPIRLPTTDCPLPTAHWFGVHFWSTRCPPEAAAVQRWLNRIERSATLVGQECCQIPVRFRDGRTAYVENLELYEFVTGWSPLHASRRRPEPRRW